LLASIGMPDMDPDVSRTNTISRGVMSASTAVCGGSMSSENVPPRASRCASSPACGVLPDRL